MNGRRSKNCVLRCDRNGSCARWSFVGETAYVGLRRAIWYWTSLPQLLLTLASLAMPAAEVHAAGRAVAVLYDDSGSMISPRSRWIGANFSLQVMSALLVEGDELYLAKMNAQPQPRRTVVPGDVDAFLASLQREPPPQPKADTPYDAVDDLLEALGRSSAGQKWLIVVTDGEFTNFNTSAAQAQIDRIVRPLGIKPVFVLIERSGSFDAARFWNSAAGAAVVEASKASQLPQRMEELAALLTGRDSNGLALDRSGSEVQVSTKFPLRGLVVLTQGSTNLRVASAFTGIRPMTIRGHAIRAREPVADIPRHAHVAHLFAQDGIAAGEKAVSIRFSSPVDSDRVKVYPEVAARMEVGLVGADGQALKKDGQGYYGVCTGESVTLQTRLVGSDGKPLTPGRQDLGTFQVGYETLPGQAQRSTIAANQEFFESRIAPSVEVRILPFARYPGYFNYQGDTLTLRPVACKREVVVKLETPLDRDGLWSARVDQIAAAAPLRFGVTIDGQPATEAELKSWAWRNDSARSWEHKVQGGKILLIPRAGCCVMTWARPKAHAGQIDFAQWQTGNSADKVFWPAPVRYSWLLPESMFGRLWWLYGCPAAALLGIAFLGWYLWMLARKDRFDRRAVLHKRKRGRETTLVPLVRGRDWLSRWFWPSPRESRVVEKYRFTAIGGSGQAVLVAGKTLSEQDEIVGWRFDPQRHDRKLPQVDARLLDRGTIRHRASLAGPRDRFDIELQYARMGLAPKWPE